MEQLITSVDVLFLLGAYCIAVVGIMAYRRANGDKSALEGMSVMKMVTVDLGVVFLLITVALVMHGSMTSHCSIGAVSNANTYANPASLAMLANGSINTDLFAENANDFGEPDYTQKFFLPEDVFEHSSMEYVTGFLVAALLLSAVYRAGDRTVSVRENPINPVNFFLAYSRLALVAAAVAIVASDSFDDLVLYTTAKSTYSFNATLQLGSHGNMPGQTFPDMNLYETDSMYALNSGRCLASMMATGDKPRSKLKDLAEGLELIKLTESFEFACNESRITINLATTDFNDALKVSGSTLHDCQFDAAGGYHPGHSVMTMNITSLERNEGMYGYTASVLAFAAAGAAIKVFYMIATAMGNSYEFKRDGDGVAKYVYHAETFCDLFADIGASIIVLSIMMSTTIWSCQFYTFSMEENSDGEEQRGGTVRFLFASCYVYAIVVLFDNWASITDQGFPFHKLVTGVASKMYSHVSNYGGYM